MNKLLSQTMISTLSWIEANGGHVFRHPGGFWTPYKTFKGYGQEASSGTKTIHALVSRGYLEYDEWKEGREGRFPISAKVMNTEDGRR